jgi:seryl-tRNA synthetase
MLGRRFIWDNPEAVKAAVRAKGSDPGAGEPPCLDQSSRKPRLLAAVADNYQTEDQQVRVPQERQPYLGGRTEL